MKGIFVIYDTEIKYASRLADYFSNSLGNEYDVRSCSNYDSLYHILESEQRTILLIDEECTYELEDKGLLAENHFDRVIVLTSSSSFEGVYKYQKASLIFEEVMGIINHNGFAIGETSIINKGTCTNQLNRCENAHMSNNSPVFAENEANIRLKIKKMVQEKLLEAGAMSDEETLKIIDYCIDNTESTLLANEKNRLRNSIFFSIRGLDVLEELICDESITEIMVNGEKKIFIEKNGKLELSGKKFDSRTQLIDIIQKIVSGANRTVNMREPIVDARLPDGSRVNVVLEPVSLTGPSLTIRRFPKSPLTAETLCSLGAVSPEMLSLLRKLVYSGYNILISGSTGSGKTTFLNMLTSFIPGDERIITIEDSAELRILGITNLVSLETRNANSDGSNEIGIRDLIRTALRMRPDRIIVGEVRGAEAIDMIQAFSVGQDGSMSTIHANSAEDALYRLEMLMLLGKLDMPLSAIRRQIAIGVDIIIQLGRLKDKSRKVLEIREVISMNSDTIETGLLYKYEKDTFVKYSDITNTYKLEKANVI